MKLFRQILTRGPVRLGLRWDDQPEGAVIDPTPEPKRYLILSVQVFGLRFAVSFDMAS